MMAVTHRDAPWTYEDLLRIPENGKRYEVIEGTLYEMTGTSWAHGTVVANLIALLLPLVRSLGGIWRTAPIDVFFAGADPVQPDIFVLLPDGNAEPSERGVEGAPDLIVEVLSPSNRAHDLLTKRGLYERAGVREYWMVDPVAQTVEVLSLQGERFSSHGVVSESGFVISPLLSESTFAATDIFAGLERPSAID
jgi:Uma2 family endonuclease